MKYTRQRILAEKNEKTILDLIKKYPDHDRNQLAEISGMSRSTIYDVIIRLQYKGLIYKGDEKRPGAGPGRRRVLYQYIEN